MTRCRIDTLISSNYYLTPEQRSLFGTISQDISHKTENTPAKSHQRMLRRAAALCNGLIFMCNPDSTNACLGILKEPPLPLDAFEPMRSVPPWLDGTQLGCPAQSHHASLRRYTNAQSAPSPTSSIKVKCSQTRSDFGELIPSLISRLSLSFYIFKKLIYIPG